jgi:hypothetical protein
MDYFVNIETPSGTSESNPLITTVNLTKGILVSGQIIFSDDCDYKHHITFYIADTRLAPFNRDQNYVGDNSIIKVNFDQDFHKPPFQLQIVTWNTDKQSAKRVLIELFLDPFGKQRTNKNFIQLSKELIDGYLKGTERNAVPSENDIQFYKS